MLHHHINAALCQRSMQQCNRLHCIYSCEGLKGSSWESWLRCLWEYPGRRGRVSALFTKNSIKWRGRGRCQRKYAALTGFIVISSYKCLRIRKEPSAGQQCISAQCDSMILMTPVSTLTVCLTRQSISLIPSEAGHIKARWSPTLWTVSRQHRHQVSEPAVHQTPTWSRVRQKEIWAWWRLGSDRPDLAKIRTSQPGHYSHAAAWSEGWSPVPSAAAAAAGLMSSWISLHLPRPWGKETAPPVRGGHLSRSHSTVLFCCYEYNDAKVGSNWE